jgi:predicted alpha/beta-fold hydrolase
MTTSSNLLLIIFIALAPTLIVHAKDDPLQLYRNGIFAAVNIPRAQLLSFDTGGHMVIAIERAKIRPAIESHILAHVPHKRAA